MLLIATLEDHPHACGDKSKDIKIMHDTNKSSPRVWGQESEKLHAAVDAGIIPTRVGTSVSGFLSRVPVKDHPHACGDKSVQTSIQVLTIGSSPRVWGQEYHSTLFFQLHGIIPTRVGTST